MSTELHFEQAWQNFFPSLDSPQNLRVSPGYNVASPYLYRLGKMVLLEKWLTFSTFGVFRYVSPVANMCFGYYTLACSRVTLAIMSWLLFTIFNLMTSFYSLWLSTDILSFVICGIFLCTVFNDSLFSNINKIYIVL